MRKRPIITFRPGLEPMELRNLLSAGVPATSPVLGPHGGPPAPAGHLITAQAVKPNFGYLVYRRTNPNRFNDNVLPPFGHVLVQATQPVPGQVYNVLDVVMRNGTAQTFTASSGFGVKLSGQFGFTPILTGNETWKPGQEFIFYVLTKKYYPIQNQVTGGFVFDLGGAKSVAIPGPSGIFLRLKYDPAKINQQLDWIVRFSTAIPGGPGGTRYGISDTAIYEFVSSKTRRNDYGGLF